MVSSKKEKTHILATLSIICAFAQPFLGIVLGILALWRIEETKQKGRKLAIWGIVLSVIMLLFWALVILAWVGLIIFSTLSLS